MPPAKRLREDTRKKNTYTTDYVLVIREVSFAVLAAEYFVAVQVRVIRETHDADVERRGGLDVETPKRHRWLSVLVLGGLGGLLEMFYVGEVRIRAVAKEVVVFGLVARFDLHNVCFAGWAEAEFLEWVTVRRQGFQRYVGKVRGS